MIINRVWAMPNKWTFTIKPIAELLARYVGDGTGWIDPFAGENSPAEFTNDLNPDRPTTHHIDALEFLISTETCTAQGVLFDPPYSYEQYIRSYKMKHAGTAGVTEYLTLCKKQIARIVTPGGIVISFGWNSEGEGKVNSFTLEGILLVCHGACHNDTIVTVERKIQGRLDI